MIKLHPIIADTAKTQGITEGFAAFMELAKPKNMATAQPLQAWVSPRDKEIVEAAFADPQDLRIRQEVLEALKGLSDVERKRALRKIILKSEREIKEKKEKIARDKEILDRLLKVTDAAIEVVTYFESDFTLQSASKSRFNEFRKSFNNGHILYYAGKKQIECPTLDYEIEVLRDAETFIVTHDWAGAFSGAEDLRHAPFRLPYEVCAFEFQVSGRRIIALATDIEGRVVFSIVTECQSDWLMLDFVFDCDGALLADSPSISFAGKIGEQIRAICIALDAAIATTEAYREVHSGVASKNSHTPLKQFHTVSLVRKPRALSEGGASGIGRPKRLHFRRGHWRHFATFKTWVKWCLVGNPDLGFIDKQYRL